MSRRFAGEPDGGRNRPVPVTLTRVYVAAESFGFNCHIGADRLVFPWRDHVVTVYLDDREPRALVFDSQLRGAVTMGEIAELAGEINEWNRERLGPTLSLRIGDDGRVLVRSRAAVLVDQELGDEQLADIVRCAMETSVLAVGTLTLSFPELENPDAGIFPDEVQDRQEAEALDGPLPRDRHRRQVPEVDGMDEEAAVSQLLAALDRREGATGDEGGGGSGGELAGKPHGEKQLGLFPPSEQQPPLFDLDGSDVDGQTVGSGPRAGERAGRNGTGQEKPQSTSEEADTTMNARHSAADHGGLPDPVTVDRIREVLTGLGVEKTQGGEDVIIAWINEVLFGFFIDNGPSYLVKGHWDPDLDPEAEFLRIFLLCNDWNEAAVTTKAFCHEDEDGLQVRVEFTTPVAEGLNDAQLEHNTTVAINQILQAIDSISTDVTGESAVGWP